MYALAECQAWYWFARDVELVRPLELRWVSVGRSDEDLRRLARWNRDSAKRDILGHHAPDPLHRRLVPQSLRGGSPKKSAVNLDRLQLGGVLEQEVDSARDQAGRRLVACAEEEDKVRQELLLR